MKYGFGVDLGGTTVKIAYFDETGNMLDKWEIPTVTDDGGSQILPDIAASIAQYRTVKGIAEADLLGIGIGVPGPVDSKGNINRCVNLGWGVFNITKTLSDLTGLPVAAGNDANVAALGEFWKGGGKGCRNMVFVTLGTGVGGGIVINGAIWDGFNGFAAEIGHMIISRGGRECACGKRGCLEAYCSATALIKETKRIMSLYPDSLMWQKAGGKLDGVSGKTAFEAAREDDFAARLVIEDYIDALAVGVSNIVNIFQPHVVCIGGGISREGDNLMKPLHDRVERMSFGLKQGRARVEAAKFRNDAGIIGAALLGLQNA